MRERLPFVGICSSCAGSTGHRDPTGSYRTSHPLRRDAVLSPPNSYPVPLHPATCLLFHYPISVYLEGHPRVLAAMSWEQDINPDCSIEFGFMVTLDKQQTSCISSAPQGLLDLLGTEHCLPKHPRPVVLSSEQVVRL